MSIVTSETIANHKIVKTLGLVRGNAVRARHIGKDIMAGLRNIVGGLPFLKHKPAIPDSGSSPV